MPFNRFLPLLLITCLLFSVPDITAQTEVNQPEFIEDEDRPKTKKELREERRLQREAEEKARREEAKKNQLPFEDRVYDEHIKTILVHKAGLQLNPPVIQMGGVEKIEVRFDDLHPYSRTFAYSVEHCTHDWQGSDLIESEYLEGFFTNYINDFSNSFNTTQPYMHHRFAFPNEDLRITRSGNYLLKVFADDDPSKVIFTRRFMVTENVVMIDAKAAAPRNVALRQEGQEIQFTINHGSFPIPNPFRDLNVVLIQNQRWNSAITGLNPVFVKGGELVYDYDAPATFMAGNEYRPLDIKSFTYQMENILRSERTPLGWQILLAPDQPRVFRRYETIRDINGQAFVKNDDGFADHTESDYATVHFTLKVDQPLIRSEIYVYGGYNNFALTEENKMTYNPEIGSYQCSLHLKQGFYNYKYAVVEEHVGIPDITIIEGSFMETENAYMILVYHRNFSNNYDQLIGVSYVNANRR
ncbi:MAG: DUF5103 domain-containing protein [Cryomorphaceae bacterium]|nr:MAG: DUF5103 domain-containing protein [Cryomorphaceae bacterium]